MVKQYIEDREKLALEIQKYYNSLGLKSKRCFWVLKMAKQ